MDYLLSARVFLPKASFARNWVIKNIRRRQLAIQEEQLYTECGARLNNFYLSKLLWFFPSLLAKNLKDLLDGSDYHFLSYTTFITKHNIKTNHLEYYKVVSALKHFRKKYSNNQNFTTLEKAADNLFSSEKVCRRIYQILVKRRLPHLGKLGKVACWRYFFKCTSYWENTYQLPFLCTTETKLRVFQFKFLHRRVATNDFLINIGKKGDKLLFFLRWFPRDTCASFLGL